MATMLSCTFARCASPTPRAMPLSTSSSPRTARSSSTGMSFSPFPRPPPTTTPCSSAPPAPKGVRKGFNDSPNGFKLPATPVRRAGDGMGFLTRREALLRTMGCAAAGMIPLGAGEGRAAPVHELVQGQDIDRALRARVEAGEIPGVVAMAANGQSVLYEGAFGFRHMTDGARMSTDT